MMAADLDLLTETVRKKDYDALVMSARIGPDAIDPLTTLLRDPDEEIRELAVYGLEAAGGERAGRALVPATLDANPQVATTAARALHQLGRVSLVGDVMAALWRSADPFVRLELALVVGRFAGPAKIPELCQRLQEEPSPEVRWAILAALARMGHDASREAFANALAHTQGEPREAWLDLAEYIHQPWLLQALAVVLDDPTTLVRSTGHGPPELNPEMRACDFAVHLIATITGAAFSFPVARTKNYSPVEIDEARRVAKGSS